MRKYIIHNKVQFGLLMLLKLLNTVVFLYFSVLIKNIINVAIDINGLAELSNYIIMGVLYCFLLIVCFIAVATVHSFYMNQAVYLLKRDYCQKLFSLPYEKFTEKESATYISNLTNDINMIRSGYFEQIFAIVDAVMSIVMAFIFIAKIDLSIAIYVLVAASILPLFPLAMEKKMLAADKAISDANEHYTAELKMILSGMNVVKTFSASKVMTNRFKRVNEEVKNSKIHNDLLVIGLSSMSTTVTNIIKVGLVIIGVFYALHNRIDIGSVTALFVLSSSFYNPVMQLCYEIGDIMGTQSVVEKIKKVLDYQAIEKNAFDESEEVERLRLQDVNFNYAEKKPALNNINLDFEAGKKYLIIGESGSGKTTLFKLLLKMSTDYRGKIFLNDTEYREIGESVIYDKIGYAQQDSYIFNGTLRENIDINKTGDEKRLYECIKKCRLESFVSNLPNGVDTNIGEEINKISAGEKLRICLARTLYKDCTILLLDEITSALDVVNSRELEKVISSINDKIVINICHKFSKETLEMYDKIIILESGKIVDFGDFNELREKSMTFNRYLSRAAS